MLHQRGEHAGRQFSRNPRADVAEDRLAEFAEWLHSVPRPFTNVRVEAVHELRKIREDNFIGIIGRPFVRSPGFVGQWMRVFQRIPTERTRFFRFLKPAGLTSERVTLSLKITTMSFRLFGSPVRRVH
jgi:hypothetical protein